MSFFERLAQVWKGFMGLWISDLENKNPEAVYEAAIEERIKKHRDLKKAVSGIVYLRNKLQTELEQKEKDLKEVNAQLPVAVEEGDDEVAMVLLQKQGELEAGIAATQAELEKISGQAEDAKKGLLQFQGEIEKLKREKVEMLAKKANAEARIKIQETLDGLSTDADVKALDNIRESIHKKAAEADVVGEVKGESLDSKLAKIRAKTQNHEAKQKLEEMKRQMAARKEAASEMKKTI
jgi:phage shock protein A